MNQNTLRTIWISLALLMSIMMLNIYGLTQKAGIVLSLDLPILPEFDDDLIREAYAVHGLRFFALFFWLVPFLAIWHARTSAGGAWEAFPFRLLDIKPESRPGKWLQRIAFVFFIAVPLFTAVHLWKIVAPMQVCQHVSSALVDCTDIWSRPVTAWLWDDTYRVANWGPTYDPLIEPAVAALLTAYACYLSVKLLIEMFRAGRRPSDGRPPSDGQSPHDGATVS